MKRYELVLVIDASASSAQITEEKEFAEKLLGDAIKLTDDIGLLQTAYPMNGQDQAYYVSYMIESDGEMEEIKTELRLRKNLIRWVFYVMNAQDEFLTFSDVSKKFEEILDSETQDDPIQEEKQEENEVEEKQEEEGSED